MFGVFSCPYLSFTYHELIMDYSKYACKQNFNAIFIMKIYDSVTIPYLFWGKWESRPLCFLFLIINICFFIEYLNTFVQTLFDSFRSRQTNIESIFLVVTAWFCLLICSLACFDTDTDCEQTMVLKHTEVMTFSIWLSICLFSLSICWHSFSNSRVVCLFCFVFHCFVF